MINKKEELLNAYWTDMAAGPGLQEVTELACAVFPQFKDFDRSKAYIPLYDIPRLLLRAGDFDAATGLIKDLVANQPPFLDNLAAEGKGDYVFEAVGYAIISMKEGMYDSADTLTAAQHLELYDIIAQFDMYKSGKAIHPFLGHIHLNRELQRGNLEVFEALYSKFKEAGLPNSHLVLGNVQNWLRPFLAGRMDLHKSLMNELIAVGEKDPYVLAQPAKNFWLQKDVYIADLSKRGDLTLWKDALSVSTDVFGLNRYYPLKKAVADGRAFGAFKGQIDLFLAAKRQGYPVGAEEFRKMLDPIERLAKAIGANWTKKIPAEISSGLTELFDGADKKLVLQGKRSKHLIEALNELMPGQGWMNFARQQDKKSILINQMDI